MVYGGIQLLPPYGWKLILPQAIQLMLPYSVKKKKKIINYNIIFNFKNKNLLKNKKINNNIVYLLKIY